MGAFSLARYKSGWLVGSDVATLYYIPPERNKAEHVYQLWPGNLAERVMSLNVGNDGSVLMWTDSRMDSLSPALKRMGGYHGVIVKSVRRHGNIALVATGRDVVWYDTKELKPIDTIWKERSTTAFFRHDTIFIGTLDGLFLRLPGGKFVDAGKLFPEFRGRITDIVEASDGLLWVATYQGLYAFTGNKVLSSISEKTGLVSDICRTINLYKDELWIGQVKTRPF